MKAKEKPLLGGEGLHKLTQASYGPQPVLQVWQREAARLFEQFWRTGHQRHLAAFVTHVSAMTSHQSGAMQ